MIDANPLKRNVGAEVSTSSIVVCAPSSENEGREPDALVSA